MQMPLAGLHGQLVAALEHSELAVALFDEQDLLRWANPHYERMFLRGLPLPVPFADVLRHGFRQGFGVQIDCGDIERFLRDILPRRRSIQYRAFATDTVDGIWLWMTETLLPDGWLMSIASDITSLKQQERQLQLAHADAIQVAMTDPLTGASSRRHITGVCEAALRQLGEADPLSIALIDLDRFKQVNDQHGHDAGDEVLRSFVANFRAHSRTTDALGRWGGEEFLLVMPGASAEQGVAVVERMRDWRDSPLPGCTYSAGVAQAACHETLAALLKRADVALYEAKRQGGNCCRVSA